MNKSKFYFGPVSPKNRFLRFFQKYLREKPGIQESRVRRRFRESRVRRRSLWGVPSDPRVGFPQDQGLKDPDGFPWDPLSGAQGSLARPPGP